jgi:hypothetical protein
VRIRHEHDSRQRCQGGADVFDAKREVLVERDGDEPSADGGDADLACRTPA